MDTTESTQLELPLYIVRYADAMSGVDAPLTNWEPITRASAETEDAE